MQLCLLSGFILIMLEGSVKLRRGRYVLWLVVCLGTKSLLAQTPSVTIDPSSLEVKPGEIASVECCYNHGESNRLRSEVSLHLPRLTSNPDIINSCDQLNQKDGITCSPLNDDTNCRTILVEGRPEYDDANITCFLQSFTAGILAEDSASFDVVEEVTDAKSQPTSRSTTKDIDGDVMDEQNDDKDNNHEYIIGIVCFVCVAGFVICVILFCCCCKKLRGGEGGSDDGDGDGGGRGDEMALHVLPIGRDFEGDDGDGDGDGPSGGDGKPPDVNPKVFESFSSVETDEVKRKPTEADIDSGSQLEPSVEEKKGLEATVKEHRAIEKGVEQLPRIRKRLKRGK